MADKKNLEFFCKYARFTPVLGRIGNKSVIYAWYFYPWRIVPRILYRSPTQIYADILSGRPDRI